MASRATVISVEEYLSHTYEPDCDYIDGHIEERNVGETDHSWLQAAFIGFFYPRRKEWNITVLPEQRVPGETHPLSNTRHLCSAWTKTERTDSYQAAIYLHRGPLA